MAKLKEIIKDVKLSVDKAVEVWPSADDLKWRVKFLSGSLSKDCPELSAELERLLTGGDES